MASAQASDSAATAFLVERYLPPTAADSLSASVSRVAMLCADVSLAGPGVQYVHSVYLPSEDTCFCVFRGTSADAVRDINREAGFALDRITDALLLLPTNPSCRTSDTTDPPQRFPSNVASREEQR